MSDTSLVFNIIAKDKASKVFEGMKGKVAAAGALIGGAFAGNFASSILDNTKSSALLTAQLGAAPAEAARVGKAAGVVYAKGVAENMDEANDAIKALWQNGLVGAKTSDAALEMTTSRVVNLSKVSGEESGRIVAAVKSMVSSGIVKTSQEAFDVLTKGIQSGVNKSEDLLDTFEEYPTSFQALGLNATEAMGILNQGLKGGARNADLVADAIKEFGIRAVDGSKASAAGYKALGLNAKKMTAQIAKGGDSAKEGLDIVLDRLRKIKDPVKRNAAAVGLFGTKAEDMKKALGGLDVSTAVSGLGKVKGAADAAGQTLEQSAGAKLESFKRKAQAALVVQLSKAIPYIDKTFGWLSKNSSWVTPLALGLAGLATAIATITYAMKAWAAIQAILSSSMWATLGPILLIIAAVAVVAGGIYLLATKTQFFQTIWGAVWGFMKGVAAWFAGPFAGVFKAIWGGLVTGVKNVATAFRDNWNAISAKVRAVGSAIKGAWNATMGAIRSAAGSVVGAVTGAWSKAYGAVSRFAGKMRGAISTVKSAAGRMFSGVASGFKSGINAVIRGWNSLHFSVPGFSAFGHKVGGFSIGTPHMPYLAKGGTALRGGLAMVGERGPEVISMPTGASVTPLSRVAGAPVRVVFEFRGGDRELKSLIRKWIRTDDLLQGA